MLKGGPAVLGISKDAEALISITNSTGSRTQFLIFVTVIGITSVEAQNTVMEKSLGRRLIMEMFTTGMVQSI